MENSTSNDCRGGSGPFARFGPIGKPLAVQKPFNDIVHFFNQIYNMYRIGAYYKKELISIPGSYNTEYPT